jgi:hypothetical protein
MLKNTLIGCVLMISAGCAGSSDAPIGSAANSVAPLPQAHYVVFFDPSGSKLDAEGRAIVREAAAAIGERRPSEIEIVVPKAPGSADVAEARYVAIENIISSTGEGSPMRSRVVLASNGINLPGASDRAEIRLIP